MITILVFYSPDRKPQFEQMVECMGDMDIYPQCQKILLVDGEPNADLLGWETHQVPRHGDSFNWSRMWEVGVDKSRNDVILYLDSDRILPRDYLRLVLSRIEDNRFLFSQDLFTFKKPMETSLVKEYRDRTTPDILRRDYDDHKKVLWYDPRYRLPCEGPGKGVMSGNTAFTKATYLRSGGVDPFYADHGAYADSDFHKQCYEMGMEMFNLGVLELHLYHEKVSTLKQLTQRDVEILCLNNYIYYCSKWGIGFGRARHIAACLKLSQCFVKRVRDQLDAHLSLPENERTAFVPLML